MIKLFLPLSLLGVMAYLAISSAMVKSFTFDEVAHLPAGYTYLTLGDYRLNLEAPPLVKKLGALPLLSEEYKMPLDSDAWSDARQYQFGQLFLYGSGNDLEIIRLFGRLPIIALTLLLGWFVFCWSRELFGEVGGLVSLTLFAFSPNIIAHGRLVTMDLPLATFGFVASYFAWRYLDSKGWCDLVLASLALGGCLVSKFSGFLFIPSVLLPLFVAHRSKPLNGVLAAAKVGVIVIFIIYFAYGFRLDSLVLYVEGMSRIYWNQVSSYSFYLGGEFSETPWWYYYFYALLVKSTLPTLVLLAVSFVCLSRSKAMMKGAVWVLLPVVLFLLVSVFDTRNLGLRRVLPIYPFLFVLCGLVAKEQQRLRSSVFSIGVVLLLGWQVIGTVLAHPNYLNYFNEAVGGEEGGIHHLDDSNIDWGQDLILLERYLVKNRIEEIALFTFGQAPFLTKLVHARRATLSELTGGPKPGSGYFAVSAHYLLRLRLQRQEKGQGVDWLESYEPVARVGSIYIYLF